MPPPAGLKFSLLLLPPVRQVPEWTKCSSREKRKEKKVEKPFYSDSEGESGPTESADSGELAFRSSVRHRSLTWMTAMFGFEKWLDEVLTV